MIVRPVENALVQKERRTKDDRHVVGWRWIYAHRYDFFEPQLDRGRLTMLSLNQHVDGCT